MIFVYRSEHSFHPSSFYADIKNGSDLVIVRCGSIEEIIFFIFLLANKILKLWLIGRWFGSRVIVEIEIAALWSFWGGRSSSWVGKLSHPLILSGRHLMILVHIKKV